jgi:hypothetical protein
MGFLDKLFGGKGGSSVGDTSALVNNHVALYDDPEAHSDRGLSITGRAAGELREVGRKLHKAGGRPQMEAGREALRAKYPWAVLNLENIWSNLPEWKG